MNAKRAKEWLRRLETLPEMQEVDVVTREFLKTLACSVRMLLDRAAIDIGAAFMVQYASLGLRVMPRRQ